MFRLNVHDGFLVRVFATRAEARQVARFYARLGYSSVTEVV